MLTGMRGGLPPTRSIAAWVLPSGTQLIITSRHTDAYNPDGMGGEEANCTSDQTLPLLSRATVDTSSHPVNYSLCHIADPCPKEEIYCVPQTWKEQAGFMKGHFPFY